jgi:hypothetical protein
MALTVGLVESDGDLPVNGIGRSVRLVLDLLMIPIAQQISGGLSPVLLPRTRCRIVSRRKSRVIGIDRTGSCWETLELKGRDASKSFRDMSPVLGRRRAEMMLVIP